MAHIKTKDIYRAEKIERVLALWSEIRRKSVKTSTVLVLCGGDLNEL